MEQRLLKMLTASGLGVHFVFIGDVSNQCLVNGAHVRLAVGLDYHDASPVSGIRVGGGVELMNAGVHVSQLPMNKASSPREQMEQIQQ